MPAYIHHIATETPEHLYSNEFARERMKGWVSEPRAKRMVEMIYDKTGIDLLPRMHQPRIIPHEHRHTPAVWPKPSKLAGFGSAWGNGGHHGWGA